MAEMFSKNLFWEIDETDLNTQKHARFIIERVLSRGRMSDWFVLTKLCSFDKMKEEVVKIRYLDKVTLNFCSTFFRIPKSKFRCYNQPKAIQELWDF